MESLIQNNAAHRFLGYRLEVGVAVLALQAPDFCAALGENALPGAKDDLTVSNDTVRSTEHCSKDFACLTGNLRCNVEQCIGQEVLVCLSKEYCRYQARLGFSDYVCTCPVRNEIHKTYHI